MEFSIEKFVSPFIDRQFPDFYQEDGPNFIQFVKAYYEWMEETGNPIGEARNLFDYRDIDNTLESFIEHFQKKYLYGIPFNVIINKRYLLKHILDVYRSKSSIQCYKLLFRLIYNEEADIYLPSRDVLRFDGTWVEPKYLEVSYSNTLTSYVGKQIVGLSSNTTAVVESYVKEAINENIVSTLYISNISPRGGDFVKGEKIVVEGNNTVDDIIAAPTILGSLSEIEIINGGQEFDVGDVLKIAHRDIDDNSVISYGIDGQLKVMSVSRKQGAINFTILNGGSGFTSNSMIFIYNQSGDTGSNASFQLGSFSYTEYINYNTNLIVDNYTDTINALSANTINSTLTFVNNQFGTILSLANIHTGGEYLAPPTIFIRSTLISNNLVGNVSYDTTSNNVSGTSTLFQYFFTNNQVIALQANSSNSDTIEYHVIKTVNSNTSLTLYDAPTINSTASAVHRVAPTILPANFAFYEDEVFNVDGSISGENHNITAIPSQGNNVISSLKAINSGKGYIDGEFVKMYLYNALNTPTIITGGINYSNGELLVFVGGGSNSPARGFVSTNGNGTITSCTLSFEGSGYITAPDVRIKSANGSGAYITTSIKEFNTVNEISGLVVKGGIGKKLGYWSTTRGFLNSDKYLQDSYYYQDFSYEIQVPIMLNKYRSILYNTFHTSGAELFGKYQSTINDESTVEVLYQSSNATIT